MSLARRTLSPSRACSAPCPKRGRVLPRTVYTFYAPRANARPSFRRDRARASLAGSFLATQAQATRKGRTEASRTAPRTATCASSEHLYLGTRLARLKATAGLELAKRALSQAQAAQYLAGQIQATRLMAAILADQGNPVGAVEWLEKALPLYERVFGQQTLKTSSLHQQIGDIRVEQQEFGRAVDSFQKALALRKRLLAPDHPLVLALESGLGVAYEGKAELGAALDKFTHVLERSARRPLSEQTVADLYTNIGNFHGRGDFADALACSKKHARSISTVLGQAREARAHADSRITR